MGEDARDYLPHIVTENDFLERLEPEELEKENLDIDMMGAMAKHADLTLPVCTPEEIANAILFLASDESAAITGQVIVIDHGANL